MIGGNRFLLTLEFTDNPDGPGKDWSCVNLYLGTIVPDSFIVCLFVAP
jgi:hypothetical protein